LLYVTVDISVVKKPFVLTLPQDLLTVFVKLNATNGLPAKQFASQKTASDSGEEG
jgi:hypothetical protein